MEDEALTLLTENKNQSCFWTVTQPCAKALWKIFRKQITQIQGPQCYVFLFEKRKLDSQVGVSSASISSSCCVYGPGEGCSPGQSGGAGGCCGWVGPCAGPSSAHSALGRASSCAAVLPGSVSAREASGSCPSAKNKNRYERKTLLLD